MKNYVDGGETILEAFRNMGIDYIISSPGSEWGPIWEALARQKTSSVTGPAYIDCWHETLAVTMAIGYTMMTGRPQAVLLHAGAGLLQGALGIQAAQVREIPVIVMSGESLSYGERPNFEPGQQWYQGLSVVGGAQRLVEPLVKWASQVTSAETLYESVIRAGELSERVPAGPVYLAIPIEVMLPQWAPPERLRRIPHAPKVRALSDDIGVVVDLLLKAKNPIIVTDSAGKNAATVAALVALAELLAIPVVEGYGCAYANFPKSHPLHLGFDVNPFLKEVDMALLVESRVPWYPPKSRPASGPVVAISENPIKDFMVYQSTGAEHYLEGDVATSLDLLRKAVVASGATLETYRARREHWHLQHIEQRNELRAHETRAQRGAPIDPIWLCATIGEVMPPNTIYVDETVMHSLAVKQHVPRDEPQSYFQSPGGGLGQGLGIALGIKLAVSDRVVTLLIGDGSFLYNPVVQGLGASKDYDLPLLIIVFNNSGYEAMRKNHLRLYPDGVAKSADLYHGVHINGPDYSELGRPFGFSGRRVERSEDLTAALELGLQCVRSGQTFILNVVLSR